MNARALRMLATHAVEYAESLKAMETSVDAGPALAAVAGIRPHVPSWVGMLEAYAASLPPDTGPDSSGGEGSTSRGRVEHEVAAMKRDLGALLDACGEA